MNALDKIPEYFAKPGVTEALAKSHPVLLIRQMANEILRLRTRENVPSDKKDVPVARHHRCHDACALAVEVVMDVLATECPRCKGTGKIMQRTFSEPRQDIEKSCHICKGTGKIGADSSSINAPLIWLYSHCRAIGMTDKSHSGKPEEDIALFTVQLKAAAERSAMDPFVRSEIKRIAGLIEEYLPKEMNAEGAAFNLALTRGEWRSILCGLRK